MRIALVHVRHAHTGGTERYLNHLAVHLVQRGHGVHVVCRRHESPPCAKVRFERLRSVAVGRTWRQWAFARDAERHVRAHAYDVVYGLGRTWHQDVIRLGGGLHATYLERVGRAPGGPEEHALLRGAKNRMTLRIEARALAPGAYRRVVTNARMVEREVRAAYGVPPERILTIHNGVDLERFRPGLAAGAELRRSLGLEDALVVLFLGTGYGRKGLDLVLAAFPELLGHDDRAHLVVVGYDSGEARYRQRAAELGIEGRVHFLGGRRDPEVCFGAADLYVLPTRYDPFANSTLEALASGLPVITSTGNGGGELIEEGVQGSVLDLAGGAAALAQALRRWSDPERLAAGALAARALAEEHPIEAKMHATERLLEEVAAEKAREARGAPRREAVPGSAS